MPGQAVQADDVCLKGSSPLAEGTILVQFS